MPRLSLLLIVSISALTGCTKGSPLFSTLDATRIPRPTFQTATNIQEIVDSPRKTLAVQGECDSKITAITINAVGGTVTGPLSAGSEGVPQVGCATNGKFSFRLQSLQFLGYFSHPETTYTIELRGVTASGISAPSTIQVLYDPSTGARVPIGHLAAGSATMIYNATGTPTNFQLAASVRVSAQAKTLKNSNTVLQMGRAAE